MKTLLHVAIQVVNGRLDLTGGTTVETESQCIYVKNGREYKDAFYLDSERLGPDKYDFELDDHIFTVEEVQAYIDGPFAEEHLAYEGERRQAVSMVAQLIEGITPAMNELLALANKFNIPANIKVGKYTNDFRLIDAVDWDSSSMYC